MFQYSFDNDTTKKVQDSTSKTKSVLEQFDQVDKKYTTGNKTNSNISLQKIEYSAPTEQEILQKAQNSLSDYKTKGIEAIESDYKTQSEQLDKSIQSVKDDQTDKAKSIVDAYSKAKQEASNDAVKRGLARSSIIVNKLDNYNNNMLNNLAVLSSQSSEKIDSLTTQKNTLELEKNNALKSFDIAYAVKLQDKIDSINEDISKTQQSVLKYNNEIAELEAKWNRDNEQEDYEREMEMSKFVANQGTFVIDTLKRNEKYQIAKDYFKDLDKQVAITELTTNSIYKENLGDVMYNKLLKELKGE